MKFENSCMIAAPCARLWEYMTDIPKVATCLPGVQEVHAVEEGKYTGIIAVKVGIIKLRISGKISVELMDPERRVAVMSVQGSDQHISGMMQGKMTMRLEEVNPQQTKLNVETDLSLFGKIGEFGGPIIKKKADQMITEFANNVAKAVGSA